MPVSNPQIDLLLEGVQQNLPHRLVDAPKVEARATPERGFDWKPTILLVSIGAAGLLAFAYL